MVSNMNFIFGSLLLIAIVLTTVHCDVGVNEPKQNVQAKKGINNKKAAMLYSSEECHDDIIKLCPRARLAELSDLSVLQCIYNEVNDLSVLNNECQHLIYAYKRNLTKTLKLDPTAENICKDDIARIDECKNADDANGHLVACLIEKSDDIKDGKCKTFLKNVAALVFTDYRLIYKFQEKCENDIQLLKCGRLDNDNEAPTDQGKTIACLSETFSKLNTECRKEIFRIAELQSDDFHLDRALYFACKDDREKFCADTISGKGKVYKCLMTNKFSPEMSKDCQEQLTRRQKLMVENVDVDKTLISACKKDILQNNCRNVLRLNSSIDVRLTSVLLCLEAAAKNGANIEPDCKSELIEHRKMLFSDYKLNPDIVSSCTDEINTYCNGGLERGGKTLHCLFRNAKDLKNKSKFNIECIAELRKLVKIADAGEDVRVDQHLFQSCQNLITGACKSIQPGQGRMIDCLMTNIGTSDMSEDCEERLLEIQFFVARDWKLHPAIYAACKNDAVKLCYATNQNWLDSDQEYDRDNDPRVVLSCLYRKMMNTKQVSSACAAEVQRVVQTRAKSIDLMPEIQEACTTDLSLKCSNIETTKKGEELLCLQNKFSDLEEECKKVISKFTEDESQDIRLDQILMKSCLPIINEFCTGEKGEDKGDLLECLIKQKNNPKIDPKCRYGIEHHQLVNLKNINFNYKFKRACELNIQSYCAESTGKIEIIQCLSAYVLNDTLLDEKHRIDPQCRSQLRFEYLQMNEDVRLDPGLYKACEADISEHCANINPGRAQILECLKAKMEALSSDCAKKLTNRKKMDLVEQSSDYKLRERCKTAIDEFCTVDGGEIDLIECLRKNLLKPSLETPCRLTVINRIMTQNKDIRLNPKLWRACRRDSERYCKKEFTILEKGEELNGRVINCLKNTFVNNYNNMARDCSLEIEQIMREAANIDYRLDPLLTEACFGEIHKFCAEDPDDKKEDCLRLTFQQRKLDPSSKCFQEVKRIILEGAADIFADHELHEVCASDINRVCYDIAPGAAQQLKCLLDVQNTKRVHLAPKCQQLLSKRRELWKLAEVSEDLTGLQDLYKSINNSENRLYIFGVLLTVILIIFILGCTLRPAVFRNRWDKLK